MSFTDNIWNNKVPSILKSVLQFLVLYDSIMNKLFKMILYVVFRSIDFQFEFFVKTQTV